MPEIQKAIIPHNNIKLHHQKILLVVVLRYNLQQSNLFFQHIQFNTHPIKLSPEKATKIKNAPIFPKYSESFLLPLTISISVFYII